MFARLRRVRASIPATLALCLSVGFYLVGCDGGDSSNSPGGDGGSADGSGGGSAVEGGKDYMYAAEGFTLTATTKTKLDLSSSQGAGTQQITARSLIEAKPSGDKLELHGKVLELVDFVGTGQLDPEFIKKQAAEAGQEVPDMKAEIARSEAWMILDRKGELDDVATDALAQNKVEDGPSDFGLFGLPDLPKVDLEVGKEVKIPTESDEKQLAFAPITVPVEVDVTWVLRKVEGSVAELDVTVESSGATEIDAGGQTALVSTLEEAAFTIRFDLEAKVPVSIDGYQASETSLDIPGNPITITMNTDISTIYEVGG